MLRNSLGSDRVFSCSLEEMVAEKEMESSIPAMEAIAPENMWNF